MKNIFVLTLRFTVAIIFIVSGFEKLTSPSENFLYVLQAYQVFPDFLARIFSVVFPWIELLLGVFLALGLWLRWALIGLGCMSASLILVVGQAIWRKLPIDSCGCFGSLVHLPLHGVIFLDIFIFSTALFCLWHIRVARRFGLDDCFDMPRP
ncbi:MAG: MauE/DoxX family redox-associated membrane protein [Candidatus Omnitrophota bacterium]